MLNDWTASEGFIVHVFSRVQSNKMIKFFGVVICLRLFFFFNKVFVNE